MSTSISEFKRLSILIAAYNEETSLRPCVEAVLAAELPAGLDREIIIVNDGSRDTTSSIMQSLAVEHPSIVRTFNQPTNMGKGAALRRAVAESTGDLIIFQDADLEYNPNDYARMIHPIRSGRADVVFGSRFCRRRTQGPVLLAHTGESLPHAVFEHVERHQLDGHGNLLQSIRAESLRAIPLESNRFGIEPEIAAKVSRNRLRMFEVPISYNGRTYEEGKKVTWKDGAAALWFIFKYRFSSNYSDPGKVTLGRHGTGATIQRVDVRKHQAVAWRSRGGTRRRPRQPEPAHQEA
jgi:glycosyltransferase involved in cell wall biosynthesis